MSDAKLFFGGVPTGPDVKKLSDLFGVPQAGVLISHEDIAACIGAPWRSSRYRGVVEVWRRRLMKEHNIDTAMEPGRGLKILTSPERIDASESDFKSSVRKNRRAAVRISVTPDDGLTEDQRKRRDHVRQVTARAYMVGANEVKALRPPTTPPALPRRAQEA